MLCIECKDIFSNELPAVRSEEWRVPKKRVAPHPQSAIKQAALFTTIENLLRQGIIRKSKVPHYSKALVAPKPDKTFCMCVDYRALNDCAPDASWPISNVAEMLRRVSSL